MVMATASEFVPMKLTKSTHMGPTEAVQFPCMHLQEVLLIQQKSLRIFNYITFEVFLVLLFCLQNLGIQFSVRVPHFVDNLALFPPIK